MKVIFISSPFSIGPNDDDPEKEDGLMGVGPYDDDEPPPSGGKHGQY
jgi:hypothetical protein